MDDEMNEIVQSSVSEVWSAFCEWLLRRPSSFDKLAYVRYCRPSWQRHTSRGAELHAGIRIWSDRYILGQQFEIDDLTEMMGKLTCTCKSINLDIELTWTLHAHPWVEPPFSLATDIGCQHVLFDMIMVAWTIQHMCGVAKFGHENRMRSKGLLGGLSFWMSAMVVREMTPPSFAKEVTLIWKDMAALQATCSSHRRLFRLAMEPWQATALETPLFLKVERMIADRLSVEWLRSAAEVGEPVQVEDASVEESIFLRAGSR